MAQSSPGEIVQEEEDIIHPVSDGDVFLLLLFFAYFFFVGTFTDFLQLCVSFLITISYHTLKQKTHLSTRLKIDELNL
jgi:hypothetical protein